MAGGKADIGGSAIERLQHRLLELRDAKVSQFGEVIQITLTSRRL